MIDVKKLIKPIITCAAGLFSFIFLALNFFTAYGTSSYYYNTVHETTKVANGYSFFGNERLKIDYIFDGQFARVMAFVFIILIMIVSVVLIAIGTIKLLGALGVQMPFLDQYDGIITKCNFFSLIAYLSSCGGTFLFLLIFALINKDNLVDEVYNVTENSYLPGVGAVLLLIFSALAFAGYFVVDKFVASSASSTPNAPKVVHLCSACGAKAAPGTKFCPTCGGNVVEKIQYPVVYVCSGCGAKAKADNKFCPACGGAVIKKEIIPTSYFCSACGKAAKETDKFCGSCGGAIVAKQMGEQAAPQASVVYFCSACGKGATADDKFCDACGVAIVSK